MSSVKYTSLSVLQQQLSLSRDKHLQKQFNEGQAPGDHLTQAYDVTFQRYRKSHTKIKVK